MICNLNIFYFCIHASYKNIRYGCNTANQPHDCADGVNQFGGRGEIRCNHLRGFGNACRAVTLSRALMAVVRSATAEKKNLVVFSKVC